MSDILPFIWTRGNRRAYNRVVEVASGKVDSTSDTTIIYGVSGSGKSELSEKLCRDLAWEGPVGFYVRIIGDEHNYSEFSLSEAVEFARKVGVITARDGDRGRQLLASRFQMDRLDRVGGATLSQWLIWVARRLGQPAPDPVALLPIRGITEEVRGRYPILVKARVRESPASLEVKLLQSLEAGSRWNWSHSRYFRLLDLLALVPIVLLLDEADTLDPESLHSIRQLCDQTQVPLVLLGTRSLEACLLSDRRLRPLATRVGARLELGRVTLPELRSALPDLPEKIVLAIWRSSEGHFRTVLLILKALQRLRQEQPGRRVSQKAVAIAAEQVLVARPVEIKDQEEDGEEAEGLQEAPVTPRQGDLLAHGQKRVAGAGG